MDLVETDKDQINALSEDGREESGRDDLVMGKLQEILNEIRENKMEIDNKFESLLTTMQKDKDERKRECNEMREWKRVLEEKVEEGFRHMDTPIARTEDLNDPVNVRSSLPPRVNISSLTSLDVTNPVNASSSSSSDDTPIGNVRSWTDSDDTNPINFPSSDCDDINPCKTPSSSGSGGTFLLPGATFSGNVVIGGEKNTNKSQIESTGNARPIDTALLQEGLKQFYTLEVDGDYSFYELNTRPHPLESYYVELYCRERDPYGKFSKLGRQIPIHDVFSDRGNNNRRPTKMYILGEAGSGKSTLCKKVAQDWVKGSEYMTQFEIVILLRLKSVTTTIEHAVVQLCNETMGSNYEEEQVLQYLQQQGSKLLLILDGYDELREIGKPSLETILEYGKSCKESFLKLATVFITTRPDKLQDETHPMTIPPFRENIVSYGRKLFDRILYIDGLTVEAQFCFADKYFENDQTKADSVKGIIASLEGGLISSPLFLHLMCCLHEQGTEINGTEGFWEQYLRLIFQRSLSKEIGGGGMVNLHEQDFLDLVFQLGEISTKHLQRNELYIEEREIQETFQENAPFMMACGVLQKVFSFNSGDTKLFETPHKTLMEYLSTKYLNDVLNQVGNDEDLVDILGKLFNTSEISDITCQCGTSFVSVEIKFGFLLPIRFIIEMMGSTSEKVAIQMATPKPLFRDQLEMIRDELSLAHYMIAFRYKNTGVGVSEFINHFISRMYPPHEPFRRFKELVGLLDACLPVQEKLRLQFFPNISFHDEICEALKNCSLECVSFVDVSCYISRHNIHRMFERHECNVQQVYSVLLSRPSLEQTRFIIYHPLRDDQLTEFLLKEYEGDGAVELFYTRNDIHDRFIEEERNKQKLQNVQIKSIAENRVVHVLRPVTILGSPSQFLRTVEFSFTIR